jgi:hypothetical protein
MASVLALGWLVGALMVSSAWAESEVPAGTRFMVELRNKLEGGKVKRGKRFEARTLEAIETSDDQMIPAGARVKGQVSYASKREMQLRLEEIETPWGKMPLVANVVQVVDEKGVKENVGDEGEIKASGGGRAKHSVIGGLLGAGIGAAVGGATSGSSGAEKGAAIGGGGGAVIGATKGGKELVLPEGTRLEVELERPLVLTAK